MNKAKLFMLLWLLKSYRAALTFGDDPYCRRASELIHDVRFAIDNDGFYYLDSLRVKP